VFFNIPLLKIPPLAHLVTVVLASCDYMFPYLSCLIITDR
jgi:hypothetical protein